MKVLYSSEASITNDDDDEDDDVDDDDDDDYLEHCVQYHKQHNQSTPRISATDEFVVFLAFGKPQGQMYQETQAKQTQMATI
eukprot:1327809-Amphidinium_carterae.1